MLRCVSGVAILLFVAAVSSAKPSIPVACGVTVDVHRDHGDIDRIAAARFKAVRAFVRWDSVEVQQWL